MADPPPYEEGAYCRVCGCTFTTFKRRVCMYLLFPALRKPNSGVCLMVSACIYRVSGMGSLFESQAGELLVWVILECAEFSSWVCWITCLLVILFDEL